MSDTLFIPSIHSKGVYKELTIQYWHINNPLRVGIALATQFISDWPAGRAECFWLVDSWVDRRAGSHMGELAHILLGEKWEGPTEPVCSLGLERKERGRQNLFTATCVLTRTPPVVEKRRGAGEPVLATWGLELNQRLCLKPTFGGKDFPAIQHIKFESLWTSDLLYCKYIQTNKQTYLKDGSPYQYETCFLPNSSLSWSKPNICPIFTTG